MSKNIAIAPPKLPIAPPKLPIAPQEGGV